MLQFFSQNSAAIQGLSAIASFLATALLIAVTWRYVALTRNLASVAREQLELEKTRIFVKKKAASVMCSYISGILKTVPKSQEHADAEMRRVVLWSDSDLVAFKALALEIGHVLNSRISDLISSLQVIAARVREIQSIPELRGYDWRSFDWPSWTSNLSIAEGSLSSIQKMVVEE